MLGTLITTHSLFNCLIGGKVDSMRRTYINGNQSMLLQRIVFYIPAPTMTLEIPRHKEVAPSILVIVETAFVRLVYIPPGEGLMICRRVCVMLSVWFRIQDKWIITLSRSTGYITECS